MLENFGQVFNLPFLDNIFDWVLSSQLQGLMEENYFLDSLQSSFRMGSGIET